MDKRQGGLSRTAPSVHLPAKSLYVTTKTKLWRLLSHDFIIVTVFLDFKSLNWSLCSFDAWRLTVQSLFNQLSLFQSLLVFHACSRHVFSLQLYSKKPAPFLSNHSWRRQQHVPQTQQQTYTVRYHPPPHPTVNRITEHAGRVAHIKFVGR